MAGSAKMNDYGKATVKAGSGAPIGDLMRQNERTSDLLLLGQPSKEVCDGSTVCQDDDGADGASEGDNHV